MDYALIVLAAAFSTVMILRALNIDHAEYMYRKEKKNGSGKDAA